MIIKDFKCTHCGTKFEELQIGNEVLYCPYCRSSKIISIQVSITNYTKNFQHSSWKVKN